MADGSWFDSTPVGGDEAKSFLPGHRWLRPACQQPAYELRPLTTGEILDGTFYLDRNNFWLFCGLAAVAPFLATVTSILQQVYLHLRAPEIAAGRPDPAACWHHESAVAGSARGESGDKRAEVQRPG